MRRFVGALVAAAVVGLAAQGNAEAAEGPADYYGRHPVNPAVGNGFCYITVPHHHNYSPHEPVVYRQNSEGYYYFVGDPTVYMYQGAKWGYYNHHPIPNSYGAGWCYIDGPHNHYYLPQSDYLPRYRTHSNMYWYVGAFDPVYYQWKPTFYGYTTRFYNGLSYWPRPYYVGARPLWWRQPFWAYTPGMYARWGWRGGLYYRPAGYWGPRYSGFAFSNRVGYGGFRGYGWGYRGGYGARVGVGVRAGFGGRVGVGVRGGYGGRVGVGYGARGVVRGGAAVRGGVRGGGSVRVSTPRGGGGGRRR